MSNIIKRDFFAPLQQDFIKMGGVDESAFLKEIGFAIQHVDNQPYLKRCLDSEAGKMSLKKAVLNIASVGLTLNPVSKFAYLVPRYNRDKNAIEAYLEPSYVGLVKLLTDTGSVKSINCQIVYEGDDCEIDLTSDKKVTKHIPHYLNKAEKGQPRFVYSLATLNDGSYHCEIMTIDDIYKIRERSESYKAYKNGKVKSCIWVVDEGEMLRKTVIKRHYKYLPKSESMQRVDQAIEIDHGLHGVRNLVTSDTIYYIEDLLENSTLSHEKKQQIEFGDLPVIEYSDQAQKLITMLENHQKPREENLSQKEIQRKVDFHEAIEFEREQIKENKDELF